MKKLLITFGGGRSAIGIASALKQCPDPPHIIATDSEKFALQRAIADERYLTPRGDDPLYVPFLKKIIGRTGADMVWPVHESEILSYARQSSDIHAKTFLPDTDSIAAGQNKVESYRRFKLAGVPVPETVTINDRGDLHAAFNSLGPDIWLRMTGGMGGKGALPVTDIDRAEKWIDFNDGWGRFAAARNISGGRWTSEAIWNKGELIAMQGRHNLMADLSSLTPSGITGFTRAKVWCSVPQLDDIAMRAVKALSSRPHGIFAVDLVSDKEGDLFVTEVNVGRFSSGGFSHYQSNQINPAATVMQLAFGEQLTVDPPLINPYPLNEVFISGYGHAPVFITESEIADHVNEFEALKSKLE